MNVRPKTTNSVPLAPLHPMITIGPFDIWGIDFMTCKPHSARGHTYIIIVVDYITKWAKTMMTYNANIITVSQLLFNHVIVIFGVPQSIIIHHGSHFHQSMTAALTTQLGLHHDISTAYCPKANGQVKAVNKVLISMLQRTIGKHEKDWNLIILLALWAYQTSAKITTQFTPFEMVYGLEVTLPIEC